MNSMGKINAILNYSLYEGISSELYKELEMKIGNNDVYVLYSELKEVFCESVKSRVKIGLSDSLNNQLSEKMDLDEISL